MNLITSGYFQQTGTFICTLRCSSVCIVQVPGWTVTFSLPIQSGNLIPVSRAQLHTFLNILVWLSDSKNDARPQTGDMKNA